MERAGTAPASLFGAIAIDAGLISLTCCYPAARGATVVTTLVVAAVIAHALLMERAGASPAVLYRSIIVDALLVRVA
jgi:hypothetical protein